MDNGDPGGLLLRWIHSSELDILHNVLLFAPLGFSLAGCLRGQERSSRIKTFLLVCLCCLTLSYGIESLQKIVPGRFPSLADVVANVAGGAAGAILLYVYETRSFTAVALAYIIGALALSIPLQRASQFQNWNRQYRLLIGNEATGDRPWKGSVSDLAIWNTAMSELQVRALFTEPAGTSRQTLLSRFHFAGGGPYRDEGAEGVLLAWSCEHPDTNPAPGVTLNGECYLESDQPPHALTDRLKETSQFTLATIVKTAFSEQKGPARIISISHDGNTRNLTLAQQGTHLVFRLRTPLTGENGSTPELVVPDVFSTDAWTKLAVTYDGDTLRAYANAEGRGPALELGPGAALFSYLVPLEQRHLHLFNTLYYVLIFVPWGVLVLLSPLALPASDASGFIWLALILFLPCVALETLLANTTARGFRWETLILSIICTAAPVTAIALIRIRSDKGLARS